MIALWLALIGLLGVVIGAGLAAFRVLRDRSPKWGVTLMSVSLCVMFGALFAMAVALDRQEQEESEQCRAAGGTPVDTRDGIVCVEARP